MPELDTPKRSVTTKEFQIGDIVYWVGYSKFVSGFTWPLYEVKWGVVDWVNKNEIDVVLYELRNRMTINGVSIWDWQPDYVLHKLPKGWTYNTKLFDMDFESIPDEFKDYRIDNPDDIRKMIDNGVFIEVGKNIHWRVTAEITKTGWQLVRKSDDEVHVPYVSVFKEKAYFSYAEADAERKAIEAEWHRQSELTDEEWSKEQIQETINRWAKLLNLTPETEQYILVSEYLLNHERIAEVITRIGPGLCISWRYEKNKKWKVVEASVG